MGIEDPVKTMTSSYRASNDKLFVNEQKIFTLMFKTISESRSQKVVPFSRIFLVKNLRSPEFCKKCCPSSLFTDGGDVVYQCS